MSFVSRTALFTLIVSFSGAIVVFAARDIRSTLKPATEQEIKRVDELVKALRGDELFHAEGRYDDPNKKLPLRKNGQALPDYDMKKIKGFLMGLLGGGGETEKSDNPAESEKKE